MPEQKIGVAPREVNLHQGGLERTARMARAAKAAATKPAQTQPHTATKTEEK